MSTSKRELRFAESLKAGWNLGNTLETWNLHFETDDPADYETYWGNPEITEELLIAIKEAGFQTIRIPVTWQEHVDQDFLIDSRWLDRVKQVVDRSLNVGLKVILNTHHEEWYTPDETHFSSAEEKMQRLWTQIGETFADYDERLLFESMNEPRLIGTADEWTTGPFESQQIVNQLNEVFVDTIRELGGNNQKRYLLLPTYAARYERAALSAFQLPKEKRLMVSIHLYAPYDFAQDVGSAHSFDSRDKADTGELDAFFEDIDELFLQQKIPVVITEFAAGDKDNLTDRIEWTRYIVQKSRSLGVPYVWWDQGGNDKIDTSYRLYDRYKNEWMFPELVEVLVNN
ncbi:glycoside hydrolase family 5 protein [Enterococcus olivae]